MGAVTVMEGKGGGWSSAVEREEAVAEDDEAVEAVGEVSEAEGCLVALVGMATGEEAADVCVPLVLTVLPLSCGELGAEEFGDEAALLLSPPLSLSLSRLARANSFLAEEAAVLAEGEPLLVPGDVGDVVSSALPCLLPIARRALWGGRSGVSSGAMNERRQRWMSEESCQRIVVIFGTSVDHS